MLILILWFLTSLRYTYTYQIKVFLFNVIYFIQLRFSFEVLLFEQVFLNYVYLILFKQQ